jgi:FlaA1/EpsC-like NDP-sugar epimerase
MMHDRMTGARRRIVDLPRLAKRAVLMTNDGLLLLVAVWLAFSLRWGRVYWPDNWQLWFILLGAPLLGVAFFQAFHLYRVATRFIRDTDTARMYLALGLAVLSWVLLVLMVVGTGNPQFVVPRSVIVIYAIFAGVFVRSSRRIAAWLLRDAPLPRANLKDRRPVLIYGAGAAGVQLQEALEGSGDYKPIAFLDDASSLMGQRIGGLKVYPSERISRFMLREGVTDVLLAIPDRSRRERKEVYAKLAAHDGLNVRTMPSLEDIAAGRVSVTDLRSVELEDLLGRDPVPANTELLARAIRGKSVMITGAGGSIGAELTRQILRQAPRRLVLFELSEAALYTIETEIADSIGRWTPAAGDDGARPEVVSVLGSVLDDGLLERTIAGNGVQTIYHAAAYKHVPIVEHNPVAGLRNNTFGTATLANLAVRLGVQRVTLISTDKAVRPTNVMGASKRLAELIFQAHAAEGDGNTVFTMVRFGNVLGSSGSVVPRFMKQIRDGGPVTVTDPEVTRYFMSISEAAGLVVQASAMARGGEVFVLDMGESVKIDDLARMMIRLMNRRVLDETNPDGDIEIRYVGMRHGEKKYEELLIDDRTSATEHPSINQNNEPYLEKADLERELQALEEAMATGQMDVIDAILMRTVEGYRPDARQPRGAAPEAWPAVSRTLH